MLYSGKVNGTHEFGVGFIVNRKIKDIIKDFKPMNKRICAICIRTKLQNMWIINEHAPTEEKEGEIRDDFYQTLEATFDSLQHNDIKVLMGDFNAKIGREEAYRGTIGQHSLHEVSSNSGLRLIILQMVKIQ
jgi:hypothetical protein